MKSFSSYLLLTKPGILLGNLITTVAGFALASSGSMDFALLFATLLGLGGIIGSACVVNNIIDRVADQQMPRTQNRALAVGRVSVASAVCLSAALGLLGAGVLAVYTNALALSLALAGFLGYVGVYSFAKYHTEHGTLIGSVAGALPPVVGYVAVSRQLDAGAGVLFAMLVLWQMPHFFAIAIYRLPEYAKAGIPVLPVKRGVQATKVQMLAYVVAFVGTSCLLTGRLGWGYLGVALGAGAWWIGQSIQGFRCANDRQWARQMFLVSLVVIVGLCAAMVLL